MFVFSLQLLLERKNKEVGKLIEETEKSIKDLAENIDQAKVVNLFFMSKLWLQVFIPTKQEHARLLSFNQLISVFR